MNFDLIKNVSVEILGNIPNRPFLCLPLSALLFAILKDNHGVAPRLVTGNLAFDGNYLFKQDFTLGNSGADTMTSWAGHAWVEVEGFICDLSLFRTIYSASFTKPCKQSFIKRFGTGRGLLCARTPDLDAAGLRYEAIDTLDDKMVTGIIQGLPFLL